MRGDQLARQWRILQLIEANHGGLTVAEISRLEDVSLKTAYRDIEALQLAGFPLTAERVEKGQKWFFVDDYKFKLPSPFTLTELMSLHLYGDLVKVFKGTAFYDSLESVFKKVRVTLPRKTTAYLNQIQNAFSVGIKPYKEYGRFREILNQVNQAVIDGCTLEMAYHSLRSEKETLRKVDPYKIRFYDGSIYLIGHCHLRGEVRTFVVDRIKMLRMTKETFTYPADFSLEEYMRHSFKVIQDELYTVKIRISPDWARWAGEKIWHESQESRVLEDGSLELTMQVAGLDEIKMWVLSLGPEAEVVEPDELRQMVVESLSDTLNIYEPAGRPAIPDSRFKIQD